MATQPSLKLAALATVAIPGLDVVATRPPQHESADFRYGGVLDAVGRHWVVQAPLHDAAALALDTEAEVLKQLAMVADQLPFAVVEPAGFAEMNDRWRAMVYEELPGDPLDLDTLTAGPGPTASLARAIAAIHELPHRVFAEAGLPVYTAETYRQRRLAEVDDAARTGRVPGVLLARWERALEDVSLWRFTPAPVHGDLAQDNVLLRHGSVVAVTHWANAHVGDPAEDVAWLYAAAPEAALDTLEEAYALARREEPDPHLVDRALLYSELAVARWLLHGVRIEDSTIIADAEGMLGTLARQVADSGPIGHSEPVLPAPWEAAGSLSPAAAVASPDAPLALLPEPSAPTIPSGEEVVPAAEAGHDAVADAAADADASTVAEARSPSPITASTAPEARGPRPDVPA